MGPRDQTRLTPEVPRTSRRKVGRPRNDTLVSEAACLHPDCSNTCRFDATQSGRKPLFCSSQCRIRYSASRVRLLAQLSEVDSTLSDLAPHSRHRRPHLDRRSQIVWILERFGGVPTSERGDLGRTSA